MTSGFAFDYAFAKRLCNTPAKHFSRGNQPLWRQKVTIHCRWDQKTEGQPVLILRNMEDDWLNDSSDADSDTWGAQADAKRMQNEFMTVCISLWFEMVHRDDSLSQAGAREGIDAGREATIQAGFDAGFATASRGMQLIQCCRAVLSAIPAEQQSSTFTAQLDALDAELKGLPPPLDTKDIEQQALQTAAHEDLLQRMRQVYASVLALLPAQTAVDMPAAAAAAPES